MERRHGSGSSISTEEDSVKYQRTRVKSIRLVSLHIACAIVWLPFLGLYSPPTAAMARTSSGYVDRLMQNPANDRKVEDALLRNRVMKKLIIVRSKLTMDGVVTSQALDCWLSRSKVLLPSEQPSNLAIAVECARLISLRWSSRRSI